MVKNSVKNYVKNNDGTYTINKVQLFTSGEHTDNRGNVLSYSEEDLDTISKNYDPEKSLAVGNIDHEKKGEAKGWIQKVYREGKNLFADINKVSEEHFNDIKQGKYPFRSIAIKGKKYIDHFAWLGAKNPAVKGMAPALSEFSENDTYVYEFSEYIEPWSVKWTLEKISAMFSGIRDYMLTNGLTVDEANKIIDPNSLKSLVDGVVIVKEDDDEIEIEKPKINSFSENEEREKMEELQKKFDESIATIEALKKEIQDFKAKEELKNKAEADRIAAEAKAAEEKIDADAKEFSEKLIADMKILPVMSNAIALEYSQAAKEDNIHCYSEADIDKKKLPKVIEKYSALEKMFSGSHKPEDVNEFSENMSETEIISLVKKVMVRDDISFNDAYNKLRKGGK